jgi:hypothetical protein
MDERQERAKVRDRIADERDDAVKRDRISNERDDAADQRDRISSERDRAADERDEVDTRTEREVERANAQLGGRGVPRKPNGDATASAEPPATAAAGF